MATQSGKSTSRNEPARNEPSGTRLRASAIISGERSMPRTRYAASVSRRAHSPPPQPRSTTSPLLPIEGQTGEKEECGMQRAGRLDKTNQQNRVARFVHSSCCSFLPTSHPGATVKPPQGLLTWCTDVVRIVYIVSGTDGVRMVYTWCTYGVRSHIQATPMRPQSHHNGTLKRQASHLRARSGA